MALENLAHASQDGHHGQNEYICSTKEGVQTTLYYTFLFGPTSQLAQQTPVAYHTSSLCRPVVLS